MDGFWISPSNPNAEQGGGDLINPTKQTVDVRGPWVVFPNVDCAEAQGQVPLPHAALPMSTIQTIAREAAEQGVVEDQTGGVGDIREKIAKPADETVAWEDIPVEDQNALAAQFPKGGRTRTQYGVTTIPSGERPDFKQLVPGIKTEPLEPPSALEQIAAELPIEEPDAQGGYSPPADLEETPSI